MMVTQGRLSLTGLRVARAQSSRDLSLTLCVTHSWYTPRIEACDHKIVIWSRLQQWCRPCLRLDSVCLGSGTDLKQEAHTPESNHQSQPPSSKHDAVQTEQTCPVVAHEDSSVARTTPRLGRGNPSLMTRSEGSRFTAEQTLLDIGRSSLPPPPPFPPPLPTPPCSPHLQRPTATQFQVLQRCNSTTTAAAACRTMKRVCAPLTAVDAVVDSVAVAAVRAAPAAAAPAAAQEGVECGVLGVWVGGV